MEYPVLETSRLVFSQFFQVKKETYSHAGTFFDYYAIEPPGDAVAILAETTPGELLLLKEFRYPTKTSIYGLPGGYLNPGESKEEAAKREFLEETGCIAEKWHFLGSSYPYPGMSGQKIHYFHASEVKETREPQRDPHEVIECVRTKIADIKPLSKRQTLDGVLLAGLWYFLP